jgi:NAD(P)-dependent dehydrogenase (short-subunit alcohol dehydrogenase family)
MRPRAGWPSAAPRWSSPAATPIRGERAAAAIRGESGNERVSFLQADHSTVGGNQELAERVIEAFASLDVLVNNVGGSYATRWETADGYEATLAMNLVGPFALTRELLPLLRANAPARCINVGSAAFQMWKRDPFEDVQSRERFVGAEAYAQTKLLNLLFTLALARRLAAEQVTVNTLHPGLSWTEMTQSMTPVGFRNSVSGRIGYAICLIHAGSCLAAEQAVDRRPA